MSDKLSYEALEKLWDSAGKVNQNPPSARRATLGTFRYIASKYPDRKLRPDVQALLDDPAYSDSVVIEIFGGGLWVVE